MRRSQSPAGSFGVMAESGNDFDILWKAEGDASLRVIGDGFTAALHASRGSPAPRYEGGEQSEP